MSAEDDSKQKKKRLGQYFTGFPLARLLAELAQSSKATTIIDPMGGSGDMLVAARAAGAVSAKLATIELDPTAIAILKERPTLGEVEVLNRNAFDPCCYQTLGWAWDLVITNPPYVRYQNAAKTRLAGVHVPSSADVQRGLIATIEKNPTLGPEARALLRTSCEYSGLSDLAVPSWILAASLVQPGGRLALVVPDTWLSRQYATPVLRVIHSLFDLELVVEDQSATWFPDAQVRTTLVVAQRRTHGQRAQAHRFITIPAEAASNGSLVGAAFPECETPDKSFAEWVRSNEAVGVTNRAGIAVRISDGADLKPQDTTTTDLPGKSKTKSRLPERMRLALGGDVPSQTLAEVHWSVGQGLRTGANDFFYLAMNEDGTVCSALIEDEVLHIDQEFLVAGIRRQADLRKVPAARSSAVASPWHVLVIDDHALQADADAAGGQYRPIAGDLERLIRIAATTHHRQPDGPTIPELSAVRVNMRGANKSSGKPQRFWYQLPEFTRRHRPDLFVARVNATHPIFYSNTEQLKVIDANFSTLYQKGADGPSPDAMLGLLSSTWVAAFLEASGTVMGGGALKIEAAHLRQIPIPLLSTNAWQLLGTQGRRLADRGFSTRIQDSINKVIETEVGIMDATPRLNELATGLHNKRSSSKRGTS